MDNNGKFKFAFMTNSQQDAQKFCDYLKGKFKANCGVDVKDNHPFISADVPHDQQDAFAKYMHSEHDYGPEDINEMGCGGGGGNSAGGAGTMGFSIPVGVKQRKKGIDEAIALNDEIHEGHVLSFLGNMDEQMASKVCEWLDEGDYASFVEAVKEHAVREVVKGRVKEVVRKKPGGGGYVLYSPNSGKKKAPKPVGNFPTKAGAKRAELARFPPKDPKKLERMRKEIEKLRNGPKRDDKGVAPKVTKKESYDVLKSVITSFVNEALFHEEKTGSDWDDYISRMSKTSLANDKKFQSLQKNIAKKTQDALENAFRAIAKSVNKKKVKLKNLGVKTAENKGKTYLAFSATIGNVAIEPIAIYIEGGVPKIELSTQAKVALTKSEPSDSKLFRAELVTVQESILDNMDDLEKAIAARDKYLTSQEDGVDSLVTDLSPLQISLLKKVLVSKYRKIS